MAHLKVSALGTHSSCGKSTQLSYLRKSKDTLLIETDSNKSESHPVKLYLSKSLKVFGLKYSEVSKVNGIAKIYLSIKTKSKSRNSLFQIPNIKQARWNYFFLSNCSVQLTVAITVNKCHAIV